MTIASAAPLLSVPLADTNELMDRIEDCLMRVEADSERLRPQGEIIIGDRNAADATKQVQHFFVRDQARRVARMLDRADERIEGEKTSSKRRLAGPSKSKRQLAKLDTLTAIDDSLFGQNLYRLLQDCASQSVAYGDHIDDYLQDLIRETALLDALSGAIPSDEKTWLTIASLDEHGRAGCVWLRDLYRTLFEKEFGCTVALADSSMTTGHCESLRLDGPLARVLAPLEAGTHLRVSPDEGYTPLVVSSHTGFDSVSREPGGLPPVLRIYSDPGATLDIRSRLLARGPLGRAELRAFILSSLPTPRELITSG
jgi:hypothetical protein